MLNAALTISFPRRANDVTLSNAPADEKESAKELNILECELMVAGG